MNKDELENLKKLITISTKKHIALMEEYPHKVIYPSRTEVIIERNQWCKKNIKGPWGEFNLGNDHLWCFQDICDAVYFKTYWGSLTWKDFYED
jgi:restriction endonuclease S subunit